ncbi:hypothetical protein [Prescottella equi]|uniref:hypothetical protein n=1 Tax=Rhodococcus hoagii TaxID=43767 RepID=UPI00274157EF|nr:hypothetical protein [Prescottella equi]MDP8015178.1 hypothetical protein [Prescottella equi]
MLVTCRAPPRHTAGARRDQREELFTLPSDAPGGETYYATTTGDIRLVSLYSTRNFLGSLDFGG